MVVKEASDLLLQLRHVTRLAQGNGMLEKMPLDVSWQIIPSRDHRRAEDRKCAHLLEREFRCWPFRPAPKRKLRPRCPSWRGLEPTGCVRWICLVA